MWPIERLHTELRLYRLSRTRPRDEIYLALGRLGPCRPLDIVRELSPTIDKHTVYRTLRTFLSATIATPAGYGLIELAAPFIEARGHLVCRGCGRRGAFRDKALETKLHRISAAATTCYRPTKLSSRDSAHSVPSRFKLALHKIPLTTDIA